MVYGIVGGLGLFLFGMRVMSDALKKALGQKSREFLELITSRPYLAILVGALVTSAIQSSSAMTVMTVGLVNAGILSLHQAIGVVMGANIGTTFTAWLVSITGVFKISHYALFAVGIGFAMSLCGHRRTKRVGQVLLGFGILFLGLSILKDALGPLKHNELVKRIFTQLSKYPFWGLLAGVLLTMCVQSSSATIALVQLLAFQGLIGLDAAIAVVLGDNIGTTITAEIAAFKTTLSPRRVARAHTMFNVLGVSYMFPLVWCGLYGKLVCGVVPGPLTSMNIMAHIAVAHSMFNIFNTLVFLPFIRVLENICIKLVPGKEELEEIRPQYLEKHLVVNPSIAIDMARRETVRMLSVAWSATKDAVSGFFENDEKLLGGVAQKEEVVDNLQNQITRYLIEVSQKNIGAIESEEIPVFLHSVNDIERIGDHAENIMELGYRKIQEKLQFTEVSLWEMKQMYAELDIMFHEVVESLQNLDMELARNALQKEQQLNKLHTSLRTHNLDRLRTGEMDIFAGTTFVDCVNNFEKIGDHLTNIAQAIVQNLKWEGEVIHWSTSMYP